LPSTQTKFAFAGDVTGSDDIFIINFKRDKLKEGLQKGYWDLELQSASVPIIVTDESRQSDILQLMLVRVLEVLIIFVQVL